MSRTVELVLGLISGILGLISGTIVLFVETAFPGLGDQSGGWFAILFSIIIIISTVILKSKPKLAGIGFLIGSLGGLWNVGLFFLIPGILAIIASFLALIKKLG